MAFTLFEHEAQPFDWTDADLASLDRLNAEAGTALLAPTVVGGRRMLRAA